MSVTSRFIILLRGINVGGHNKVRMADLRQALTTAGFADVTTYIQSGNIVADAGERDEGAVVRDVEQVMTERFELSIPIVARAADDWATILAANPFPDADAEPKLHHVSLCDRAPSPDALDALDTSVFEPDEVLAIGRSLYLRYPNGSGRSKLTVPVLERKLNITTTARNWSTMLKLAEMIAEES